MGQIAILAAHAPAAVEQEDDLLVTFVLVLAGDRRAFARGGLPVDLAQGVTIAELAQLVKLQAQAAAWSLAHTELAEPVVHRHQLAAVDAGKVRIDAGFSRSPAGNAGPATGRAGWAAAARSAGTGNDHGGSGAGGNRTRCVRPGEGQCVAAGRRTACRPAHDRTARWPAAARSGGAGSGAPRSSGPAAGYPAAGAAARELGRRRSHRASTPAITSRHSSRPQLRACSWRG